MENPPKKFFRLAPGREVRLRYAYFVTCRDVVKDATGEVVELRCTYDPATRGGNTPPDGRKVKATLHWVAAAGAIPAEVRLVNRLFLSPDPDVPNFAADLNADSLEVLTGCMVEPAAVAANSDAPMQFERQGYFRRDEDSSPGKPVFVRTVGLRDTFAKTLGEAAGKA
jgi:glutaminyl-tRNA synthetase